MECLLKEGVRDLFGYPGGAVLPLYDSFAEYPLLNHILVRHEQGAGFAAQGFARATGDVGVCIATSGPGATNLVTAIADAYMDSIPVVFITGQVPRSLIGSDAFQETDVLGITIPITKHNYLVESASDLAKVFKEAFHLARSGRPGPVLIDIPKDVFIEEAEFYYPEEYVEEKKKKINVRSQSLDDAVELILASKKPVIIAGHGVQLANASSELKEFVEKSGIPAAFTVHGLGSLKSDHPLNLKMLGMHGHAETNYAVDQADLIIAVGMRFDDRITGNLKRFAANAKVIHIEIDPAEIGKNVTTDVALVGDCKIILADLVNKIKEGEYLDWLEEIERIKNQAVLDLETVFPKDRDGNVKPFTYDVIRSIRAISGDDAIIVTDVGQHQMFTCQSYEFAKPRTNLTSGGLGSMGFSLPTAMGAKVAKPDVDVWSISGDGGFQMNLQELMTILEQQIPVKIVIIQNYYLGMVRQWQELFYKKNYASSPMSSPIYKHIAAAYSLPYFSAERLQEVESTIKNMHEYNGPCLGEFFVETEENVLPMVPSGSGLDETMIILD